MKKDGRVEEHVIQKSALGKGLASLLGANQADPSSSPIFREKPEVPEFQEGVTNRDRHLGISMAVLEDIHPNQYQPRRDIQQVELEELVQSIQSSGIIQPLVVRKRPQEGFELIAGERRLRAAKLAGLKRVPIVIRRSTDKEALELALIENIQRKDLNCVDEALAYFQLVQDFGLTQEEVSQRVGKERTTVANYLRLLRLPEEILEDLKKDLLSFGHAKVLLSVEDPFQRMEVRNTILKKKLSVREAELLVGSFQKKKDSEKETQGSALKKRLHQLAQELTRFWSTRVQVQGDAKVGKIVIHYSSEQDLNRIVESMHTSVSRE